MPTYTVFAAPHAFTDEQRAQLALRITEVHARCTGAPKSFVQTLFFDVPPGACYIGARPADPNGVWVYGHIRSGRDPGVRTSIALGIRDGLEEVAGTPRADIWVYLNELSHTDMIEFGEVLPPAGSEPAWIEALPPAARERLNELD